MLVLKNEKIPVSIDGEVYQLSRPKNKDAELLMKFSGEGNGESQYELAMQFLVTSGLPREIVEGLDLDLTGAIIEHLMPEKKD